MTSIARCTALVELLEIGRDLGDPLGAVQHFFFEIGNNDVVDPNTVEVNPAHVDIIDLVGHRYRVAEAMDYIVGVHAKLLF